MHVRCQSNVCGDVVQVFHMRKLIALAFAVSTISSQVQALSVDGDNNSSGTPGADDEPQEDTTVGSSATKMPLVTLGSLASLEQVGFRINAHRRRTSLPFAFDPNIPGTNPFFFTLQDGCGEVLKFVETRLQSLDNLTRSAFLLCTTT